MRQLILAVAAVAALGATAYADTVTLPVGASLDVPAGWKVETTQNGYMLASADEALAIYLLDTGDASVDDAWKSLTALVGDSIGDLAVGTAKQGRLGGMDARMATATGHAGSDELGLVLAVITTPASQYASLAIISKKPDGKQHEAELQAVMDSIQGVTPDPNDPFWAMPGAAGDFARKLTAAVDSNDGKAVYAMMAAKVQADDKVVKKSKLKKKLLKAAKHGLAAYFHVDDARWGAQQFSVGSYELVRGYGYLEITQVKGKWVLAGWGQMSPD